jgi:hypothetical protein
MTQLLLPLDETAPGYLTVEQARAIFGDLMRAVHRAFDEDDGNDETLVLYSTLMMARGIIETWYMREGVENDARYCAENGVR